MGVLVSSALTVIAMTSAQPVDIVTRDMVDLIEHNHFHDEKGKLVFDQVIFYDWCEDENRFNVRAWRLLKKPTQTPVYDRTRDLYSTTWHDGEVLRRVESKIMRETWTQHDPELTERAALPKIKRRELQMIRSSAKR